MSPFYAQVFHTHSCRRQVTRHLRINNKVDSCSSPKACRWKNSSVERGTCGCAGLRGGSVNVGHCMDSDVKLVVRAAQPLQLSVRCCRHRKPVFGACCDSVHTCAVARKFTFTLQIQHKTINLYWVLQLLCMSVRSINWTHSELPEHSLSLAVRVGL